MDEKEKKYREISSLLEALFDAIPDIIGVQDARHNIIRYNKAGYEFLHQTPESVQGKKCFQLINRERQCDICAISQTYETKKEAREEKYFPELDLYLDTRSYPVLDEKGEIEFVIEHLRDITVQKKAELALIDSKARFEAILSALPDLMFIFSREGVFLDYHSPNPDMLLIPPESFLNKKAKEILPPNLALITLENLQKLFDTRKPQVYWYDLDFGGKKHYYEGRMVLYGEDKAISILRDISETKYAEQEQQKLYDQMQQMQKMDALGRLAGGIAHDFNNILVPIMGFAEIGMMDLKPENKLFADLEMIRDAASRAADLTRQILAFSRKQVLAAEVLDLNKVITEFQKMIARLIGENIEIRVCLNSNIFLIEADKGQLNQVLLNIVINARDAMPQGGKLTIETKNARLDLDQIKYFGGGLKPGDYVLLAISDTGVGMDSGTKQHLFEPFYTTKDYGKGTGLGLSTVYGIVKQHQGHISCYSEKGRGTTFKIYLPRAQSVQSSEKIAEEPDDMKLNGTETILVVEDDAMVRKFICESLESFGYQIIEAADPNSAIEIGSTYHERIDLIVSDVIMPKMNGQDVFYKILSLRPELKVLFISGYAENGITHHGFLQDGLNFLQKPFSLNSLAKKVRQILDS